MLQELAAMRFTRPAARLAIPKILRAALRKLGFGAGMAAFALLGVDDFARMVGQRMAKDNKVAEQVAKEFQGMGVASATPISPPPYYYSPNCLGCCTASDPTLCQECCDGKTKPSSDPNSPRGKCYQACDGIG